MVIAEDSLLVREGVRLVIQRQLDLEVVGEATDLASLQALLAEDLPDVLPGHEHQCVIAPQTFVVLRKILVGDYLTLVRLEIGAVREVPFELEPSLSYQRSYRLKGLDDEVLKKSLLMIGAAVATKDSIALTPGLEVRMLLRNDRGITTKLRAGLFVQEEKTR